MFKRKTPHLVRPLVYIYRVRLSGVETNLLVLKVSFKTSKCAN
jgi:hypothetical protein